MQDVSALTRKLRNGAALSGEDVERLERIALTSRCVPANTDLIKEHETTEYVHVIESGVACRYKITPDGRRAILALLLPGDFCDLHVAILDHMDHSIGTLQESRVSRVSRDDVLQMLSASPAISRACWWATLVDEAVLREWLVNVGRRRTDQQLAHLFCELYTRLEAVGLAENGRFRMPFTQTTLGDLVGVTQVHVQRTMTQLRDKGLITQQDREIGLHDFNAVAEYSDFDATYLHLGGRSEDAGPGRRQRNE
ncbi:MULTISPECIES: Crp/Fnr family transcriptional regulator [Roseovarius]|uniref:Crp/Fnr family transcriptional regulator n=1 Tax=Roseovarius TaxID=74030 RepID=UPI00273E510C|nr:MULTISPECIES: Crp/Fnr family transcriptional regulator [unclassified Roseovarius]